MASRFLSSRFLEPQNQQKSSETWGLFWHFAGEKMPCCSIHFATPHRYVLGMFRTNTTILNSRHSTSHWFAYVCWTLNRTFIWTPGTTFWIFFIFLQHVLHLYMQVEKFILDTKPKIYFFTSSRFWCLRISRLSQGIYLETSVIFLDILHIPGTCITFVHVSDFRHSASNLLVNIPLMHCKFCIFPGHFPQHLGYFFQIFHTSGHVLHLYMWVVYLIRTFWTFSPQFICAHPADGSSAFSLDIFLNTRVIFFWIFCTFPGHVLHLYMWVAYLFWIFQTFSCSFICAHSADFWEVLHFPRTFSQAPQLFFQTFVVCLFWTFSTQFICVRSLLSPTCSD